MAKLHHSFWAPWYRHPHTVVQYWRKFIGAPTSDGFAARVAIAFEAHVLMAEVEGHWLDLMRRESDAIQARALVPVDKQLSRQIAKLIAIQPAFRAAGNDPSQLWLSVVVPLVAMPSSVSEQLVSVRNQLLEYGSPPDATVITSDRNSHALNQWGAPGWPADWFRKTLGDIWVAAEPSAPGEPKTPRDIAAESMDAAHAAGSTALQAVKDGANVLSKSASSLVSWPTLIIGAVVLYAWKTK